MSSYIINFVRERRRQLSKQELSDQLGLKYAAIGCGIVAVITVGVVGVRFWLGYQLDQLKTEEAQLKKRVLSQEQLEKSYVVFVNKVAVLQKLLEERSNKQSAIAFFSGVFGSEVLIREINYEGAQDTVQFGLRASSIFTLEQVFEVLSSESVKTQFLKVNRSELRRSAEGAYDMTVTVELKPEGAQAKTEAGTGEGGSG